MEASPGFPPDHEAVVPLRPVVPNPYTRLAQLPPGTAYHSVLDLKDAFFCIPLHPKVNLSLPLRTPHERMDSSPGLFSPRDLETAPTFLGWP
jgi:hypothetical protein